MTSTRLGIGVAALMLAGGCAAIDDLGLRDVGRAPETRETLIGSPRIGRCHMGSCTWFRVDQLDRLHSAGEDHLFRAQVRWGSSDRPAGVPGRADPRDVAIAWQGAREIHVHCAARLPALIERDEEGAWQATRIDLVGTAGAMESAATLYAAICHPAEDWRGPGFAARHGYRGVEGDPFIPLERPDDILTHGG